jgi:tetraacyldisaccharide 4'-kinase
MARRYVERVILGEERGAVSWLLRGLLWPLSLTYRAGLAVYLAVYASGLRKRHRLPVPVISVGNLTFGGTGKTPAVQTLCRMLRSQGKKVVILSRGHGGSGRGTAIVSDGSDMLTDAAVCGDEPVLLARSLPGVPVVAGKDRRETGALACRSFRPDVIVLDDGMQYWQLHRDLEIAVVDAARPFGSGLLMPAGDLREPIGGLGRASVVLLNSASPDEAVGVELVDRLTRLAPHALILRAGRKPVSLLDAQDGQDVGLEWLRGRRIVAFCGIGRPESFRETLAALGASVVRFMEFPDHHRYSGSDLCAIRRSAEVGAEALVTTEKDWARLGTVALIDKLYVLCIGLEIEQSGTLAKYISDRIDGAHQASTAEEAAD